MQLVIPKNITTYTYIEVTFEEQNPAYNFLNFSIRDSIHAVWTLDTCSIVWICDSLGAKEPRIPTRVEKRSQIYQFLIHWNTWGATSIHILCYLIIKAHFIKAPFDCLNNHSSMIKYLFHLSFMYLIKHCVVGYASTKKKFTSTKNKHIFYIYLLQSDHWLNIHNIFNI